MEIVRKARAGEGFSASLLVVVGTLVFGFVVLLSYGVEHMNRDDPRAATLEKVIGNGLIFLGIIALLMRQELALRTTRRTESKLDENTVATTQTKDQVARVAHQTNGGLDDRLQKLTDDLCAKFATREEMQKAVREAADIAVQKAASRRKRSSR